MLFVRWQWVRSLSSTCHRSPLNCNCSKCAQVLASVHNVRHHEVYKRALSSWGAAIMYSCDVFKVLKYDDGISIQMSLDFVKNHSNCQWTDCEERQTKKKDTKLIFAKHAFWINFVILFWHHSTPPFTFFFAFYCHCAAAALISFSSVSNFT